VFDLIDNEIVLILKTSKKRNKYNSRMRKLFHNPTDNELNRFQWNIDNDSIKPAINTATTQVKRVLGAKAI
jgi:hypothetical protein